VKRAYRLRRPNQFQRVRREGRSWSNQLLTLNSAPSRRRQTRCGFVVAKRIGNAVTRNRAKRRVREALRLVFTQIAPGYDLVFVIRSPAVADVPFSTLQDSVALLLRQAGLWREPRQPTIRPAGSTEEGFAQASPP
jgi:ribonuclease P protein component